MDTSSGLNAELLDDFFAEAEEHLTGIRRALLRLEESVGKPQPDTAILEELFQNTHSFKGISAIAGLAPAEAVAHAIEELLRLVRSGKAQLTQPSLEVLLASAQKMEQIVSAFRARKPSPEYESLLSDLKRQGEPSPRAPETAAPAPEPRRPSGPALSAQIEDARGRGLLWRFTFSPSHELDSHGANVNSIREQLSQMGEILNTTPRIKGGGAVAFEFLVATREPPADLPAWVAKGVSVEPGEEESSGPQVPAPMSAPRPEEAQHNPFLAPSHFVRVDLKRLDELMRITGEMVVQRSRLDAQLAGLQAGARRNELRGVQEVSGGLARSLRELREAIMRVRMVPVAEVFARMPFVVRDLARQTQKKVRLKLKGEDTSMDKYLIERLKDPLLHLVRNAFSHGVETPQERTAVGKPEEATVELEASMLGDSVLIYVRDDGRGISAKAILERARELGLDVPARADNESILKILCSSGFSTREGADRAAGRGIGMGVVYGTVRELGGNLTLETEEGRGTQFTLRLPLTLAVAEILIVSAAGQTCAVPQSFVTEILRITEAQIERANGVEVIPYRDGVLPVVRLAGLFRLAGAARPQPYVLVVTSERGSVGLLTEEVLGQKEVVVSALRDPLLQVPGVAGATELGDGKPVLILDGTALTSGSVRPKEQVGLREEIN